MIVRATRDLLTPPPLRIGNVPDRDLIEQLEIN
jgi:hypothetical protein